MADELAFFLKMSGKFCTATPADFSWSSMFNAISGIATSAASADLEDARK